MHWNATVFTLDVSDHESSETNSAFASPHDLTVSSFWVFFLLLHALKQHIIKDMYKRDFTNFFIIY